MLGTFKPGDLLFLTTHSGSIHPGDIVVFQVTDKENVDYLIVHRVMKVVANGLLTRGDNLPHRDPFVIPRSSLKGLVVAYDRDGTVHQVRGGRAGILHARLLHIRAVAWLLFLLSGRYLYRPLRESKLARRVWHPTLMIIKFTSPDEPVYYKYVWRGRTVAQWKPRTREFLCSKPFDLFIDPPTL